MFCKAKLFFGQPLEVKQQIPNDSGPKPMRGYTPWRVEEVGKLSFDNMVRSLRDSKVGRAFDQIEGQVFELTGVLEGTF